jgi:hypothetical protein
MNSALGDLIVVIEFLMAQKTATGPVAEAMDRLHNRANSNIPVDIKLPPKGEKS